MARMDNAFLVFQHPVFKELLSGGNSDSLLFICLLEKGLHPLQHLNVLTNCSGILEYFICKSQVKV
jgi:hypothetical protein